LVVLVKVVFLVYFYKIVEMKNDGLFYENMLPNVILFKCALPSKQCLSYVH